MQAVAGQPFTTTLIDPAGISDTLGARVEVPVTRAIVSAYQLGTRDGALWSVTLDGPIDPGEYMLVWRTNDPEPPAFEAMLPLFVSATGVAVAADGEPFPLVDEDAIRPSTDEIALLSNTRTAGGGGGEINTFNEETDPTAQQVDTLIDQAVEAVLTQLPTRFSVDHYDRVQHAISLYTLLLLEGSFFREQLESSSTDLWRDLFTSTMTNLNTRIEEERRQARLLKQMEPRSGVVLA